MSMNAVTSSPVARPGKRKANRSASEVSWYSCTRRSRGMSSTGVSRKATVTPR